MSNVASGRNSWLDTLEPLQLPVPVGVWPLAPGWWLLLALLVVFLLWFLWRVHRRWQSRAYRRQALTRLDQLAGQCSRIEQREAALRELPELLRRVALKSAGNDIAVLSGAEWWVYLDRDLSEAPFRAGFGLLLQRLACAPPVRLMDLPEEQIEQLIGWLRRWILSHNSEEDRCCN